MNFSNIRLYANNANNISATGFSLYCTNDAIVTAELLMAQMSKTNKDGKTT
ncbi:hypothetical protein [Colwellia sp. 75C3]|uniref:hypothetical protein n=1 Tax=Colwellia sp. 75C3 TaxID=888425 RepID=UPI001E487156|nr:hypothetical protein [Colwellia sp. 75C3]